jgi:FAD:protein FMN transferase
VKKILWIAITAALIAGLILLVQQRQGGGVTHEAQQELMGTIVKIKAHGKGLSPERFDEVGRSAFAEIARLEKEMSEWIPESPISQAARFAGRKAVSVSEEIVAVIDLSLSISRQTGGAFDISFKPLGRLWRVEKRKESPQEEEIRAALRLVDYRDIVLDKRRRTLFLKRPGMAVGLGAIAKGYAAGGAARKMAEGGIRDHIIDTRTGYPATGTRRVTVLARSRRGGRLRDLVAQRSLGVGEATGFARGRSLRGSNG